MIWPNVTVGVNSVFEDILALTTARHILCNKSAIVHTKCSNKYGIDMNKMYQYLYYLGKKNFMLNAQTCQTSQTEKPFLNYCQSINELLIADCHNLPTNTCSNYIQKATFQDLLYEMYIIFFSRPSYETCIILFLSRPFSSPIISMPPEIRVFWSHCTQRCIFLDNFMKSIDSTAKDNITTKRKILTNMKKNCI